ncbi:MAG: TonB-dependent receptor [Candidatus Zhuqueibacterota bacterium]
MKQIHRLVITLLCLSAPHLSSVTDMAAASGKIAGRVTDVATGQPLPGANVQILGTLNGASAAGNGLFIIDRIQPGRISIRVSMMGYRTIIRPDIVLSDNDSVWVELKLEETPIPFDPIVISASKTSLPLDQSPVSLSVITTREIENRNPTDLIESLETAPGVFFVGNQVNIRGSTGYTFGAGNKVLLLLDGVPVYASDTGEFNWDMLPPMDIEQIEILKGAGSTLWGASALGGVINVITKSPGPEGKIQFACNAGKYDWPHYDAWNWTNHNRLFYLRTDVSFSKQIRSLGMRISAGRFVSTGYTELGDFEKYNITGKFNYRFGHGGMWMSYAAYSRMHRGFFVQWKGQNDPYQVDEANLSNYATTNQLNLYTKLMIPLSPALVLHVRASLVRTLMGNQFGAGSDFNPAFGQGAEFQADWIPLKNHTITCGVQYQQDAGSTKYFGDHRGYFLGPYFQDEWIMLENLRLTFGFRYDRYQLFGSVSEDLFSPRAGINWQPWAGTHLRASAGSGFRAATIVERFLELRIMNFTIKANPELRAESARAYEIGVRQHLTDNWNLDVAVFENEYTDLIEAHLDLIRGQIQFRNIERARIRGMEASTNLTLPLAFLLRHLTFGCQSSLTTMNHKDLKWNEPLTYRPNTLATIKASLQFKGAQLQVDYRYASKIDAVKIYPINDRAPMKFVDVRLSQEFRAFTFQFAVQNLLNYNYAPMESNLMPERTFVVGLQGRLDLD